MPDESNLYAQWAEYAFLLSCRIDRELSANVKRNGYKVDLIAVPLPQPGIVKNESVP